MRSGADDWQTICGWCVRVRTTCRWHTCLRMTCGRHADDVRTTYVIRHLKSPTKSHSHVIRTSSAHRPCVICTSSARRTHETSVPRLFQVKQQGTALLKLNILPVWSQITKYRYDHIQFHLNTTSNLNQKVIGYLCWPIKTYLLRTFCTPKMNLIG